MKASISPFFLLLFWFFFDCNSNSNKDIPAPKLEAMWKLLAIEEMDTLQGKWKLFQGGMQGFLIYDNKKNMALHLLPKNYEKSGLVFKNFPDSGSYDQLLHQAQSYVYFAKYRVDSMEQTITHSRVSHSNPNEWNEEVVRNYEFHGDTLELITTERNPPIRVRWLPY